MGEGVLVAYFLCIFKFSNVWVAKVAFSSSKLNHPCSGWEWCVKCSSGHRSQVTNSSPLYLSTHNTGRPRNSSPCTIEPRLSASGHEPVIPNLKCAPQGAIWPSCFPSLLHLSLDYSVYIAAPRAWSF
jgi:hypothetical protein